MRHLLSIGSIATGIGLSGYVLYNYAYIILANLLTLSYEGVELSFTANIYILLAEPPKVNQYLSSTGFLQVYINPFYYPKFYPISIA